MENGNHDYLYQLKGTYYKIFNAMANSLNIEKITKFVDANELDS